MTVADDRSILKAVAAHLRQQIEAADLEAIHPRLLAVSLKVTTGRRATSDTQVTGSGKCRWIKVCASYRAVGHPGSFEKDRLISLQQDDVLLFQYLGDEPDGRVALAHPDALDVAWRQLRQYLANQGRELDAVRDKRLARAAREFIDELSRLGYRAAIAIIPPTPSSDRKQPQETGPWTWLCDPAPAPEQRGDRDLVGRATPDKKEEPRLVDREIPAHAVRGR